MRAFMAGVSAALLIASSALAQDPAADYPNRPIKIIVCVPAGGGVDTALMSGAAFRQVIMARRM